MTVKKAIRAQAMEIGFDAVGFCRAETAEADRDNLYAYLKRGNHGAMDWMVETAPRRASAAALWPEAKSVVALALSYAPEGDPLETRPGQGLVSVHARGRDYQTHVKKRLKRLARWMAETYDCAVKVFVDTAPVMEKPLAVSAGLGWRGKHTLMTTKDLGSWLFLGEVFSTLELEPDAPQEDRCGDCRACLDACPTGALYAPYRMDARRCVSYLTLEHKGPIDLSLRPLMGNRVFGCDDCLAACPFAHDAPPAKVAAFRPKNGTGALQLAELAALDDSAFRARFPGSSIKRAGRDSMVRNALIAIGNSAEASLSDVAESLLGDESEIVRDAAAWAAGRLRGP